MTPEESRWLDDAVAEITAVDEVLWRAMVDRHRLLGASAMVVGLFMHAARDLSAEGIEAPFLHAFKVAFKSVEDTVAAEKQNRTMQ